MALTDSGMLTDLREEHPENAELPMVVVPSANVTFVSAVHQVNAQSPISRIVDGMETLRNLLHIENPYALIFRTGRPSMNAGITRSPS